MLNLTLFKKLRNLGYTLPEALAELVDNSIKAKSKNVWIYMYWSDDIGKKSYVMIVDDGEGMDEDELLNKALAFPKEDKIDEGEKDLSIFDKKEKGSNEEEKNKPLALNQQAKEEMEQPLVLNQQAKEEMEQPLVLNQDISENKEFSEDKNLSNKLSPAVRKIVNEKKIDVNKIQGTGKGGRILKSDLI